MTNKDTKDHEFVDRRRRSDRRARTPEYDDNGNVNESTYKGPDRRTSLDRREYIEKQNIMVAKERAKFIKRSIITSAITVLPVLGLTFFLLVPEYSAIETFMHKADKFKEKVSKNNQHFSVSGMLNRQIEKIENVAEGLGVAGGKTASLLQTLNGYISISGGRQGVAVLAEMLNNLPALRYKLGNEDAITASVDGLRDIIYKGLDNPETLGEAVNAARGYDEVLNKMLGGVGAKDVAAAAMLLTMNEFRSSVYSGRPYDADISLLSKIAGSDPEMNAALARLAPYAKSGIMSRKTLNREFQGLAKDIILAKVQGQDVSVKEQALSRFDHLVEQGANANVEGVDTAAVVARAKLYLDQGDVQSAMMELQSLEGASAQAAMPWMQGAAGNLIANEQSDVLIQNVLQTMGGSSGLPVEGLLDQLKGNMGGGASYLSPALR